MPAKVYVVEVTGSTFGNHYFLSGLGYSNTATYCTADLANPGSSYPIPIPNSGHNPSYWKHHMLYISGTYTNVSNIRWYTDGDLFGWGDYAASGFVSYAKSGSNGVPSGLYVQAFGAQGTSGAVLNSTNYGAWLTTGMASGVTSSNPFTVDTRTITGNGKYSYMLVSQVHVGSNSASGNPQETFTWMWDEVS